jgi:hypothetical protein
MTDDISEDDGPTLEEAKAAAAAPPELVPDADDLPTDVRDGEITEENA